MTVRLTPWRFLTLALGLIALVALAACDSGAPATLTPVVAPGAAPTITPRPTQISLQAIPATQPPAVLTGVPQVPQDVQTGVPALPAPALTGGPVSGTPITTPQGASDEPPRITKEALRALMDKGQVLVIDVRNKDFYAQKHIKGAISFPFEDLDKRYGELPKNSLVVAYCQ